MTLRTDSNGDPPDPLRLDRQALDRLRELDPTGSHGVVQRVLRAYEQSLGRLLVELAQARAERDFETIGRAAHTLKSSSASVGALALSRRCAVVEKAVRGEHASELDGELDSLLQEAALALEAVRAMLQP